MSAQAERHGFEMTQTLSAPETSRTRDAANAPIGAATLKSSAPPRTGMVQQHEGFLDTVAGLIVRLIDRMVSPQTVSLRENDGGDSDPSGPAAQLAGSRVELVISPNRCLFCPLDLPDRAAEFLSGIVRAQIDRLTPWHASDVAFGFSAPAEIEGERLTVTIAAAPLTSIKPLLNSLFAKGARSVAVLVAAPEPDRAPIKIWEQRALNALQAGRIRTLLVTILATATILACGGLGVDVIGRAYLAADYE